MLSIKRKPKPAPEPPKPSEYDIFCLWFADYFPGAKPDASHYEIWKAGRARALDQAARIHATFAKQAPPGSGRAYNHSVYASLIRELHTE